MASIETMIAIGDSAMWGQGLAHRDKFATRVYVDLSEGQALPERNIKAHSGAVIGLDRSAGNVSKEIKTGIEQEYGPISTRAGRHDVPRSGLTILQQLDRLPYDYFAHDDPDGDLQREENRAYDRVGDVDLVLLDGGINDIGSLTVVRPFLDHDDLNDLIYTHCYRDLSYLIERTREKFPNAVLVVTGYFPFMSSDTDLEQDELALGLSLVFGIPAGVASRLVAEFTLRNVLFFNRRQLHYIRRAVAETNRELNGPGILFASPGITPDHSANATDPWLWNALSEGDPDIAEQRKAVCDAIRDGFIDLDTDVGEHFDHLMCEKAASFHPNPNGAWAYYAAITSKFEKYVEQSIRDSVTDLSRHRSRDATVSVRNTLERYGLAPEDGTRTALAHTTVDSIMIEIRTGNNGTDSEVSLQLAGEKWELDTKVTDDFTEHNNWEPGTLNRFAIDPLFSTDRTPTNPLRLQDVTRVVIEKDQRDLGKPIVETEWEIANIKLWLNGVLVHEMTENRILEGDDFLELDYPR